MPKQEPDAQRPILSITLALDWLRDQQLVVEQKRTELEAAVRLRDQAISDALAHGIGYRRISVLTGLSKQRIWRISVETPAEDSTQ